MRITLDGGIILTVKDTVLVSERGALEGFGEQNERMKIHSFKKSSKNKGSWLIGIVANKRRSGWGDLDGRVQEHTGTWMTEQNFMRYFILEPKRNMVVSKSHKFRKLDLEGMECDVLAPLPKGNSCMVEFRKDVGGCGGDGLGKAGHCLIIPTEKLVVSKKNDKKSLTEGKK
jgi:hypothetical protein